MPLAKSSYAQALDAVLLEAPKGLADVRQRSREPDQQALKIVSERLEPELQPVAIRWRGFELFPLLRVSERYDTNIFTTENNNESDFITIINPSLFVKKNVGRHDFGFLLDADYNKHIDNTDEDTLNFRTRFNGSLEARHDISFPFEVSYTVGHEGRGQNFSTNFSEDPIEFRSFASAFGISYNPNRLGLSLLGRYNTIEFDDGRTAAGQTVVRSDADRSLMEVEARASYELLPNHRPFISLSYAETDYERGDFQAGSFSGPERDSRNIGVLAGWQVAYKGLVEGFLGAGYGDRNYDDNAIDDVSSARIAGNISWNVTKKATLNLALKREIAEDNQVLSAAVLSQGRITLDYEFLNNLFFNAFIDRALADFQESDREDDIFSIGSGIRYVINPRYSLSGHYDFKARESNVPGLDYDRHQFMVRLNTRL
ncbi:MAG: outer membrane beta-barrel protein [Pseudomonadota bacterium]